MSDPDDFRSAPITCVQMHHSLLSLKQPYCAGVQEPSGPEAIAQNVVALALAAVLALAAGNVLWKLVSVCWALISAAARYSFVAMVLLVIAVFLTG